MAMEPSLRNLFYFTSLTSPWLVGFFMVMITTINGNPKGLVYLGGVLIAAVFDIAMKLMIKSEADPNRARACDMLKSGMTVGYNNPSFNTMFLAFTLAYTLLPMIMNKEYSPGFIILLSVMLVSDAFVKFSMKCTKISGIIVGLLVGLLWGAAYAIIFWSTGNDKLLYFNEIMSNKVMCGRPKENTFKCAVYKNGELLRQWSPDDSVKLN